MTALQAVVLGLLQGFTEFLPVSSSGHLVLIPVLLGWPDQGLAFDAMVHLGTSLALAAYFSRSLVTMARSLLVAEARPDRRLALALALGTLPAAIAGLLLDAAIETHLRSVRVVGLSLIAWGLVMWWADRGAAAATVRDVAAVKTWQGLLIGCAQAIALVPGTSRSGITISAGLLLGLDRAAAARFAFLLGLPITMAAGLLGILKARVLAGGAEPEYLVLGLGLLAAFVAGLCAVSALLRFLQRGTLRAFVAYRVALGLAVLALAG